MPAPLPLPPLDEISQRNFSFYPAIANATPNDWVLRSANSNGLRVANRRTAQEVCIPREFFGAILGVDSAMPTLALTKELELRHGAVTPRDRHVIEMPTDDARRLWKATKEPERLPAGRRVVAIRRDRHASAKCGSAKFGRVVAWFGVAAVIGSLLSLAISRVIFLPYANPHSPLSNAAGLYHPQPAR